MLLSDDDDEDEEDYTTTTSETTVASSSSSSLRAKADTPKSRSEKVRTNFCPRSQSIHLSGCVQNLEPSSYSSLVVKGCCKGGGGGRKRVGKTIMNEMTARGVK